MKKFLYILSLLFFILALLAVAALPIDPKFPINYLLAIILLIISLFLRISANSSYIIWVDFIVLITSYTTLSIGINFISPMTESLINYGYEFHKVYAGILIIFPILQLLFLIKQKNTFSGKKHFIIFILAIILSLITLVSFEIYSRTIDLNSLSEGEKIYMYTYDKYTPELIDLALYEIENGSSMERKTALLYISKNGDVIKENSDILEEMLFSNNMDLNEDDPVEYQGIETPTKLNLMVKINPEKTLSVIRYYISYDKNDYRGIDRNLEIINVLKNIINTEPSLSDQSCEVAREIVQIEKDKSNSKNLSYSDSNLMRLGTYIRKLEENCGNLGL